MNFEYEELQLLLKCIAFSASGDTNWNQTDNELEDMKKLARKFTGITISENVFAIKDYMEDEFTSELHEKFGMRIRE